MQTYIDLHSPAVVLCRRARTFGLLNLILETSNNTNSNYGQIKKIFKITIKAHDISEWNATCLMYQNLNS